MATFTQRIIERSCLARFRQLNVLFSSVDLPTLALLVWIERANWCSFFKTCLYIHMLGDFRCAPVLVVLRVLDVLTVLLGFLRALASAQESLLLVY